MKQTSTGSFFEVGASTVDAEMSSIENPIDAQSHKMDCTEKRKREKEKKRKNEILKM
jgi:hypothetical protein